MSVLRRKASYLRIGGLACAQLAINQMYRRSAEGGSFRSAVRRQWQFERLEDRRTLAADVVISEIFYQAPGNFATERQDEWVEVYNAGDADANLRGWRLTTIRPGGALESLLYFRPNTVEGNFILPAGGYAIIAANVSRHPLIPSDKIVGNPVNWPGTATLDNAGGAVILRNDASQLIARVDYLDVRPWPVFADGFGPSLRIIDPTEQYDADCECGPRYEPENWTASLERGGSPARAALTSGPGVVINEILASSNNAIGELDRIELYNTTDATIDLGGWSITDHDNTAEGVATAETAQQYTFAAGTTIGPRGYLTIDESQFGAGTNGFRVDGTSGEQLLLLTPGTPVVYSDMAAFEASEQSVSFSRIPNGEGPLIQAESQTFGSENAGHKRSALVISEVMYDTRSEHLDYVEILNRGTTTITLNETATSGWRLRRDVDFPETFSGTPNFPPNTTLAPGERLVILKFNPAQAGHPSKAAFEGAYHVRLNSGDGVYPIIKAFGGYNGELRGREGELALEEKVLVGSNALGQPFYDFIDREYVHYREGGDWPRRADGLGASLERVDFSLLAADPEGWNGSREYGGTPGYAPDPRKSVVINEIVTHTDPPLYDSIELFNTSDQSVDISGWWLTEDVTVAELVRKFVIPNGTVLPAGGYITFNNDPASQNWFSFGLDAAGEGNLYLLETTGAGGEVVRFADNISYPASFNGVTLGRFPNGGGHHRIVPLAANTLADAPESPGPGQIYFNGANTYPRIGDIDRTAVIGDVVIGEIMYNAGAIEASDSFEFIELFNRTAAAIDLGPLNEPDSDQWRDPPRGWRLNKAVDYEFLAGDVIADFGSIFVVGFDPISEPGKLAAFRNRYGLHPQVPVVGPFAKGKHLSDFGGNVQLLAPDFAPAPLAAVGKFTPLVLVDEVRYDDHAPWPASADGHGCSLKRVSPDAFGNASESWIAARPFPRIGYQPGGPRVRRVVLSGSGWDSRFSQDVAWPCDDLIGYELPSGASQLAAVPWQGIDRIQVTFDEDVAILPNAVTVSGENGSAYVVGSNVSYDSLTRTAAWSVTPPIKGPASIHIDATRVRDVELNPLDGEWTNGLSAYPSGDGAVGGDFSIRFDVVPGDANRDGRVERADFDRVREALFERIGTTGYDVLADIDGNGKISVRDWVLTRNELSSTPPQPMASGATASSAVTRLPRRDLQGVGAPLRATRARVSAVASLAVTDRVLTDLDELEPLLTSRMARPRRHDRD
jgi:hypothetical protein